MIVDPEVSGRTRSRAGLVMPLVVGALALAYASLTLLSSSDHAISPRSRAGSPDAAAPAASVDAIPRGTPRGPSVLAQRPAREDLPPLLTLRPDVAVALPNDSPDAKREISIAVTPTSRPTVYRLPDGRLFVIQQTLADRGRPALVNWFEEGLIRGRDAQFYNAPTGPFRALIWWTEGPVTYYMYSSTVAVRELARISESLR